MVRTLFIDLPDTLNIKFCAAIIKKKGDIRRGYLTECALEAIKEWTDKNGE